MKRNIIVLDCETGGFEADKHPITEIALTVIDPVDFSDLDNFTTFVKPYDNLIITEGALDSSRVTMKQINAGVDYKNLVKELMRIFKLHTGKGRIGKPMFAGHNFDFDIVFLEYLFNLCKLNLYDYVCRVFYDTMTMYYHSEAGLKNSDKLRYTLGLVSERNDIELTSAHGAASDVKVTKQILIKHLIKTRNGSSENVKVKRGTKESKFRDRLLLEF